MKGQHSKIILNNNRIIKQIDRFENFMDERAIPYAEGKLLRYCSKLSPFFHKM